MEKTDNSASRNPFTADYPVADRARYWHDNAMDGSPNSGNSPTPPGSGSGEGKKNTPSKSSGNSGSGKTGSPPKGTRSGSFSSGKRKSPGSRRSGGSRSGKTGKGRAGRTNHSRRSNKLIGSLGTIYSWYQVSHLDGLSDIHIADVADARALKRPHETAVDLAELALLLPDRVTAIEKLLAEERLAEAFFRGKGDRPELVQNYWFGDAGAGFQSPRDNHPGTAVAMPGEKWQRLLMDADAARHIWRDAGGKIRKSSAMLKALREGRELSEEGYLPKMSGQLRKIYARIPPWIGGVAASELSPRELREIVEEVAKGFSKETGYRVLAANVHREAGHDLHIHLVFTDLVPEAQNIEHYKPMTLKRMLQDLRNGPAADTLEAAGIAKPTKKQKEEELERMFESGLLVDPRKGKSAKDGGFEYQKQPLPEGSREHLVAMGPAYVSKTWLWEASGRSERVARVNEQANHFLNFKAVVIEAAQRDIAPRHATGPGDVYVDYWLSRQWTDAVMERISDAGKQEIAREAAVSVDRYVDAGRSLPEPFSAADLDLRARKLQEAEDARAAAVRAEKDALSSKKAADAAKETADRMIREALVPPTLEEVAEKMGFGPELETVGLFRAIEGGLYPERLIITGREFVRSIPQLGIDTPQEGEGAVELLATEDTGKRIKRSTGQLLRQLVEWFPSKALALANEALGDRAGTFLRELLRMDNGPSKAPAKKSGKKKETKDETPDGDLPEDSEK
ncbi:MAG: hypothetical protein QM627_05165 [Luteolibacter sp.]